MMATPPTPEKQPVRLVEEELASDKQLAMVVALLAYSWDSKHFDHFEEFLPHWNKRLQCLSTYPGWMNGKHEGDCTKQPVSCFRCVLEAWTDEAKGIINKMLLKG